MILFILLSAIPPLAGLIIITVLTILYLLWGSIKYLWKVTHTIGKPTEIFLTEDKPIRVEIYKECYGGRGHFDYKWRIITDEKHGKEQLLSIVEEVRQEGDYKMFFHENNRFFSPYAQYINNKLEFIKAK